MVNLKRKLCYDHAYLKAYVRSARVLAALQYLSQSPRYTQHGAAVLQVTLLAAMQALKVAIENDNVHAVI